MADTAVGAGGPAVPPEHDVEEQVNDKLDRVATVLLGSIAAVSAALTLFGVNSSRVWILLDDDGIAKGLLWSALLGVLAVGLALSSYLIPAERNALEVAALGLGLLLYSTSLSLALWAAASAADTPGRPSVISVAVAGASGQRTVTFTVRAVSVDEDQRIGVRVVATGTSRVLYEAAIGPAENGSAEQRAVILVGRLTEDLQIQTWRLDETALPNCRLVGVDEGPSCVSIAKVDALVPVGG